MIGLFLSGYSDAWGEDWKLFSESEGSAFFFDCESLSSPSEKNVRVMVKVVVSEKDRLPWVEKGGKMYLHLSHIKSSLEINCENRSYRTLSLELLSGQDILNSFSWNASGFSLITPGSNWDNLHKAVCR